MSQAKIVVGIGASAGGLKALKQFFKGLPDETPEHAFVVVQHLSPDHESMMPTLLASSTRLAIAQAKEGDVVEANRVYMIPPNKNLMIDKNGVLALPERPPGLNLPIDIFFRSLAESYGERAVGIICSGTGTDGSQGVRAIKGEGGVVGAQQPSSADFDSMPRGAIATRTVDFVMPLPELAEKITSTQLEGFDDGPLQEEDAFAQIVQILTRSTGINFQEYRSSTITRRIKKRMAFNRCLLASDYVTLLNNSPKELQGLQADVLINVTRFFRDEEMFKVLADDVLPKLLEAKPPGQVIRMWSAGCSTGEEAYSLAMLATEVYGDRTDFKVFATDADEAALRFASSGVYPTSVTLDLSDERCAEYFYHSGNEMKIQENLRRKVVFSQHDLLSDPPFNRMDLIVCRNVLIYLQEEAQQSIFSAFRFSLSPGGYLFLGPSESLGKSKSGFEVVSEKEKIFRVVSDGTRPKLRKQLHASLFASAAAQSSRVVSDLQSGPPTQLGMNGKVFRSVMEKCENTIIVVDKTRQLIATYGDVAAFLRFPAGLVTSDIVELACEPLRDIIPSVLGELRDSGKMEAVDRFDRNGKTYRVTGKPISVGQSDLFMLQVQELLLAEGESVPQAIDGDLRYERMREELQFTRENLRATVEELETSNEELQATNEELLASNEELQSTNEELQSVNEELISVNSEYQAKIQELTSLSNDLEILLSNTHIGVVFVDRNLCVRRYTPLASSYLAIREVDVGRSIADLQLRLRYDGFLQDCTSVLDTLVPVERHFVEQVAEHRVRIVPFKSADQRIEGLTILFYDYSEVAALERTVDTFRETLTNAAARVQARSGGKYKILLIDEEAAYSTALADSLRSSVMSPAVVHASTLMEAEELLEEQINLVIVDVGFNGGEGLNLIQTWRNRFDIEVPFIAIAEVVESEDTARVAYAKGAACFVKKDTSPAHTQSFADAILGFWLAHAELPSKVRN